MELTHKVPVSSHKKILVLCGGPGQERDVSLAGGKAVADALRQAGHIVTVADIGPDDLSALDNASNYDLVFPVLHGFFGEDGQLQTILEQKKLRYVGSAPQSSARAMDKWRTKALFIKSHLPTPPAVFITRDDITAGVGNAMSERNDSIGTVDGDALNISKLLSLIDLPCVVKPNRQGSSVGITMATDIPTACQAVTECVQQYGDALVEQYITGREFTVGIVADKVLPVIEIRPAQGFYDYQAKYISENTQYIFHEATGLTKNKLKQMQHLATQAFNALNCRDLARVDFLMDKRGELFILEVNTIPGFTSHSLLPKAAAYINIDMQQICNMIVQTACHRPIM